MSKYTKSDFIFYLLCHLFSFLLSFTPFADTAIQVLQTLLHPLFHWFQLSHNKSQTLAGSNPPQFAGWSRVSPIPGAGCPCPGSWGWGWGCGEPWEELAQGLHFPRWVIYFSCLLLCFRALCVCVYVEVSPLSPNLTSTCITIHCSEHTANWKVKTVTVKQNIF